MVCVVGAWLIICAACCNEDGTKPGCVKGYHLAVRKNSSKRFRISFPPRAEPDKNRTFEGRTLKANEFVNEALGPNQATWGPSSTIRAYESSDDSVSVDTEQSSERDAGGLGDEGMEVT